ncbi:hypothetical protein EJB05_52118 [Eragrostis curvula]|uniref:Katanin p80 subunit C-terminal domain-containing protein n=1 Tax=Eragrostis curvula TaxID=38414 RepID=A0A5J9STX5_9POAL|nr:hypothetical protein EJB05_52118 [Eragrostis curvula]
MKIWDIRKKRCIHTYKGHTRRINVLKFTPDGRWIVSGGADNSIKIWDLTAGKLLHDFILHEGPVNCLDFHPHEFLLATGSADKTVKFWDLETFESIGSSGPEANAVRSMKFNSDGKTLFCGLHESLKVLSWEPIICHDVVDLGWSTLSDLTVDDGKLLGCSFNQSCVGVWVVDLMRTEPYAVGCADSHLTESVNRPVRADSSISSVFDRLSVPRNPDIFLVFRTDIEIDIFLLFGTAREIDSNTRLKRSVSASKEILVSASSTFPKRLSKEHETTDLQLTRSDSVPLLSPRVRLDPIFVDDKKRKPAAVESLHIPKFSSKVYLSPNAGMRSHHSLAPVAPKNKPRSHISAHSNKESSSAPVHVPRHSSKVDAGLSLSEDFIGNLPVIEPENITKGDLAVNHGKEDGKLVKRIDSMSLNKDAEVGCRRIADDVECNEVIPETSLRTPESQEVHECILQLQSEHISAQRKCITDYLGLGDNNFSRSVCSESLDSNEVGSRYDVSRFEKRNSASGRNPEFANMNRSAVIRLSQLMESSGRHAVTHGPSSSNFYNIQYDTTFDGLRWHASLAERQSKSTSDEDAMAFLMENHQEFVHVIKCRKTKLEEAYCYWRGNDIKGFLDATCRLSDCAVTADVISILMENSDCITLDTCTYLLHLSLSLFESTYDRHLNIALEMVLKLVKSFGATISSTLLAAPPVGVDLEAEQRLERCHLCFQELKKVSASLISLTRRRGEIQRLAQELSLILQDIIQLSSI